MYRWTVPFFLLLIGFLMDMFPKYYELTGPIKKQVLLRRILVILAFLSAFSHSKPLVTDSRNGEKLHMGN